MAAKESEMITPVYNRNKIALFNCDCVELMSRIPEGFVDLTVTSPPYDSLRKYEGFSFDVDAVIDGLYRITKEGGVVVWVVGDATLDWCESCTSFKQALKFVERGWKLHDTMIYNKTCPTWNVTSRRYRHDFEYMFVFSKGRPKTFNPICDVKVKNKRPRYGTGHRTVKATPEFWTPKKDFTVRGNVWRYSVGFCASTTDKVAFEHPAIFPEELAQDHILSWSNEGDMVFDPFMGSGTTAKMCLLNGRRCIGAELSMRYCEISVQRLTDSESLVPLVTETHEEGGEGQI